jgi:hypothetical protein
VDRGGLLASLQSLAFHKLHRAKSGKKAPGKAFSHVWAIAVGRLEK